MGNGGCECVCHQPIAYFDRGRPQSCKHCVTERQEFAMTLDKWIEGADYDARIEAKLDRADEDRYIRMEEE